MSGPVPKSLSGAPPAAAPTEPALDEERVARLWTPERVPLTVPLAGLGERALAYGVDVALLLATLLALLFVYNFGGDLEADLVRIGGEGLVLVAVGFVLCLLAYDVAFEVKGGGRTPGKRLLKLRVLTREGRTPDVLTSSLRNVLRAIDFLPAFYGVGAVTLFFTGTRRLGDLLADTVVLSERARARDPLALCRQIAPEEATDPTPPAWSDDDVVRALAMLERTSELPAAAAEQLCARLLSRIDPRRHAERHAAKRCRRTLAEGCLLLARQRTGVAAQIARMTDAERRLSEALDEVRRAPAASSVERLDGALRYAGSELMRGTRRGAPKSALESLSLILLDAERSRVEPARRVNVLHFLAREVPAAVYLERRLIARAAAVFVGATLTGFGLCYVDGAVGRALVGDSLAGAIEEGARWTDRIADDGDFAQAAVRIILNNAWVCALAFVSGLFGGVLPLLVLFVNGLHLGSVFGYATRLQTEDTLLRFVLAHGPVELSAICVAGAAGLCLGRALLAPRRRTRLEALREEAAKGARLLVAALFAIGVIGVIEGFVSPGAAFPWGVNLLVGLLMWGLFFAWVRLLGAPAASLESQSGG